MFCEEDETACEGDGWFAVGVGASGFEERAEELDGAGETGWVGGHEGEPLAGEGVLEVGTGGGAGEGGFDEREERGAVGVGEGW